MLGSSRESWMFPGSLAPPGEEERFGLALTSLLLAIGAVSWLYGVYCDVQMVRPRRPGVPPRPRGSWPHPPRGRPQPPDARRRMISSWGWKIGMAAAAMTRMSVSAA